MVFEHLLWSCLAHESGITEERLALSIERQSNETILLFRTDNRAFRQHLYAPKDPQIACDALYFYKHGDRPSVLIFVELKGANLPHALDQLQATIGAVKPRIEAAMPNTTKYLALVISDGARPTTRRNKQRDFISTTQVQLHIQTTQRGKRPVDLRTVLRTLPALAPFVAA